MPSTYTLDAEDEEIARRLVESGRYASVAEVLRDGLRRLAEEPDPLAGYDQAELRRLVAESEASGMLTEQETADFFDELRAKYRAMAAAAQSR